MVAYADTGFLVSLYLPETTSPQAVSVAKQLKEPLPLTHLLQLEFRNALNMGVKFNRFDEVQRNRIWKVFQTDIDDGIFQHVPLSMPDVHRKALELSDKYTPKIATRSLDLLHIAAALTLNAKEFLSFDERQRHAAKGEGLKIKPV